jgi:hypothetical protein
MISAISSLSMVDVAKQLVLECAVAQGVESVVGAQLTVKKRLGCDMAELGQGSPSELPVAEDDALQYRPGQVILPSCSVD